MRLMDLIPAPYRILAVLMLIGACIGFGYVEGISRESDRRDAIDLTTVKQGEQAFQRSLDNGKKHARAAIEWQNEARIYYRKWKETLDHEQDTNLAACETAPNEQKAAAPAIGHIVLGPAWVGLYNAAWLPELASQGDTGRTSYSLVEAGAFGGTTVSPREVLDNVSLNAQLCGEDRKRLDELIDHLNETRTR